MDVRSVDSSIAVYLRYFTSDNFTGAPLPGYEANRAYLRREAARALGRVQKQFEGRGSRPADLGRVPPGQWHGGNGGSGPSEPAT